MRFVEQASRAVQLVVTPGSMAVDATVGNGHDLLTLAGLVGPTGHVFGFDIQQAAIDSASALMRTHGVQNRISLYRQSHHRMVDCLPAEAHGRIKAVMFNLGYLPGGDRSLTTVPETTTSALRQALQVLHPGGIISLIYYSGHHQGAVERDAVLALTQETHHRTLHFTVTDTRALPPGLLFFGHSDAIEKVAQELADRTGPQ
jgi:16S rRNA C1402 N4-methylase RsmH